MSANILKWLFTFCFCMILQSTIMQEIAISGIMPDLIIISLFLLSIKHGQLAGIYTGFIIGLFMDVYSPSLLGQNALSLTILGFLFGFFDEKVMRVDTIMKIFILILGLFLHDSIFVGVRLIHNSEPAQYLVKELLTRTFPRAFYTTLVLLLVYSWSAFIKPSFRR